jgi:hypothetical protein
MDQVYCIGAKKRDVYVHIPPQFVFLESYMRAFGISITGIFVSSFEIVHGFCWNPSGGTYIYILFFKTVLAALMC